MRAVPGRRNVRPVCGDVRLLGGGWLLGRGTGPGVRRFCQHTAGSLTEPGRRRLARSGSVRTHSCGAPAAVARALDFAAHQR